MNNYITKFLVKLIVSITKFLVEFITSIEFVFVKEIDFEVITNS